MPYYHVQHQYKNKKYFDSIVKYAKSENCSGVETELKGLSRDNGIDASDSDLTYFINDVLNIAKKLGHNEIIARCRELSNHMKKISGTSGAHSSVIEDALETESDCVKAFNECYEDGYYESVLFKIIECIKRTKDFHIALAILRKICETSINNPIASKHDVALYFIERVDIVIENDICVKKNGGVLGKYYSVTWKKFDHKDYKEYLKLRKGFTTKKIYISADIIRTREESRRPIAATRPQGRKNAAARPQERKNAADVRRSKKDAIGDYYTFQKRADVVFIIIFAIFSVAFFIFGCFITPWCFIGFAVFLAATISLGIFYYKNHKDD